MATDFDALLLTVLHSPRDDFARLVLADYLDETGVPSDAAWAEFIRLRATDANPASSQVRSVAERVTASLAVSVAEFLLRAEGLLRLLPAERFTVPVPLSYAVPPEALGRVTEPMAGLHRGLPLGRAGPWIVLGMVAPTDRGAVAELTAFVTGEPAPVMVPGDQLAALVARTFTRALTPWTPTTS